MDAKNLKNKDKDSFGERLTQFLILNFVRVVIIGCFTLIACWIPIMFYFLFNAIISGDMINSFKMDGETYLKFFGLTFLILFYLLVVINSKRRNDKV